MKRPKVAILHNIITPYRFPLFNALAKKNIDLTVLFMAESSSNRKWNIALYKSKINFKYKVLPSFRIVLPIKDYTEYIINPTIFWELKKYDYIVTAGWLDFSCQITYILKGFLGYKYIVWSESTIHEKSWQRILTLPYVKWLIRNADSCISIGTRSKEYLCSLGSNAQKVFTAVSTVDIAHFSLASKFSQKNKLQIRRMIGIPKNNKVILYVGQFIPRKNVSILLKSLKFLPSNYTLLLVGYGPQKDSYILYKKMNSDLSIRIFPHQEINSLIAYYAIADVFVLPSLEETWGLVVNEALAAGLPVVVSKFAGCVADLVVEGINGSTFDPRCTISLVNAIINCTKSKKINRAMSKNSIKIIKKYSPEVAAKAFYGSLQYGSSI